MRVIGTAGHVDHGKSTLVKALTGIDPDRLKEEKEREMTIDLGFAWLTLPSGETVSVVDVPGHEHFIKNMLAGVGGIDAALLVIAADEGIMPQTREHIAILDLLHVTAGVVALTKSDLIEDPEWFELIGADIRRELAPTTLANAHIVPVSARTRKGLDALKRELDDLLAQTAPRADWGKPRLPIDRVFTVAGFGTVVTGTLADGSLSVGQEVEIQPTGLKARIRGLQSHKEKVELASPGRRLAINLTGISPEELKRGDVVAAPGVLAPTQLVDVRLRWLPVAPGPLTHDTELEFFSGAFQSPVRVRLLGDDELPPGHEGWAQLVLDEPAALAKQDRFIVRQPSPSLTVGGGMIVDAHPAGRHRRYKSEVVERLERLAHGTPEDIVLETLSRREPATADDLIKHSNLPRADAEAALQALSAAGTVIALDEHTLISLAGWRRLLDATRETLAAYHKQAPLRAGMTREELRSRLRLPPRLFDLAAARAARESVIVESPTSVRLASHAVTYTPVQETKAKQVMLALTKERFSPPSYEECAAIAGSDLLAALIEQERIMRVNDSVIFEAGAYREMVERIRAHIQQYGTITVAQVRDMFGASRKYALGLMEHLDDIKLTRRVGDERVLR